MKLPATPCEAGKRGRRPRFPYASTRLISKLRAQGHRFNDRKITGLAVEELQADEIRTIDGSKQRLIWVFATIDVWSRLWPSTVVGRRSYRNTLTLFRDVAKHTKLPCFPLIATDGFEFYERAALWPGCILRMPIGAELADTATKAAGPALAIRSRRGFELSSWVLRARIHLESNPQDWRSIRASRPRNNHGIHKGKPALNNSFGVIRPEILRM